MNVDSFISFLSHSDWVFLVGLIALLGVAFAGCFSEKPVTTRPSRDDRVRPH